jgi:hypothetical protein
MISSDVAALKVIGNPSYSIEVRPKNTLKVGGAQIVFPLNDLSAFGDTDTVVKAVCNAAQAVFKVLYESGCNDKESIIFQARRGSLLDPQSELSDVYSLVVQPPEGQEVRHLSQKQGRISHCYAYLKQDLSGGELCFFLNSHNQDIQSGLSKHFQVKSAF